jgi:hypothetical protein
MNGTWTSTEDMTIVLETVFSWSRINCLVCSCRRWYLYKSGCWS